MSSSLFRKQVSLLGFAIFFFFALASAPKAEIPPQSKDFTVKSQYSTFAVEPGKPVTINVVVEIDVPVLVKSTVRPPVAVSLVIDRSGSMAEDKKLDYAIKAGKAIVRALEPTDKLAITVYDDEVDLLYPLATVKDKEAVNKILEGITDRGYTNISGGLETAIAQLNDKKFEGISRVILLSDGLANRGETNPEKLASIGANSRNKGVPVSSIGLGIDYDENLMQLLAQRGGGQYYYIKDSEDLPSVFKQELAMAEEAYSRDLKVSFVPSSAVKDVKIYGYNTQSKDKSTEIEMSNFVSGEKRKLVMSVTLTPEAASAAQGAQGIGDLNFVFKDTIDNKEQAVETPLRVEVVADAKTRDTINAGQKPAITRVQEEAALQQAEAAHVEAVTALEAGDMAKAKAIFAAQEEVLKPMAADNKAIENKMAAFAADDSRLEAASKDKSLQKEMLKESKNSQYNTAKGINQANMMQSGDKGFMVEKLQKSLKDKGFYKGEVNGVFDKSLEDAVKAFQTSVSLDADGVAGVATQKALGM